MIRFIRAIVGLIGGLFGGIVFGAAEYVVYAFPSLSQTDRNLIFTDKSEGFLLLLAAYVGALCGAMPGAIIGLVVGATGLGKFHGALVGICTVVALAVFFTIKDPYAYPDLLILTLMSIPAAAVIGAAVGAYSNWSKHRRAQVS